MSGLDELGPEPCAAAVLDAVRVLPAADGCGWRAWYEHAGTTWEGFDASPGGALIRLADSIRRWPGPLTTAAAAESIDSGGK